MNTIISLWLEVVFYSVSISIMFNIFFSETINVKYIIQSFFPILYDRYLYFTAYFAMYFFIPIYNFLLHNLGKKYTRLLILLSIIIFSIMPTVMRNVIFITRRGYSMLWLSILYIIGAYIKKYSICMKKSFKFLIVMYITSMLITWGSKYVIESLSCFFYGSMKEEKLLIEYTSPTILLSAISLLIIFAKLDVKSSFLKK
ncbi:hypothetical protein SAMN04487886_10912 [Clostridium sp. DSM 8431]|nr:hypothetical protein SAMN04487886_10912 [Clostridium sp. DSM 8431]